MRYKDVENWVFQKLINELDDALYYHDLKHTADVIRAADRLCYLEQVNKHDTVLVRTAALFHDIGFCEQYIDNEDIAADIAGTTLPEFDFNPVEIEQIQGMIMATKIPHQPKNHLEEIMCDADLDYLGRLDFHPMSNSLKLELLHYGIIQSEKEWDKVQERFFEFHRFFTPSAIKLRESQKATHLQDIKLRLQQYD